MLTRKKMRELRVIARHAASGQVNDFSGGQWVVHSTAHRVSGSQKNERNDRKRNLVSKALAYEHEAFPGKTCSFSFRRSVSHDSRAKSGRFSVKVEPI